MTSLNLSGRMPVRLSTEDLATDRALETKLAQSEVKILRDNIPKVRAALQQAALQKDTFTISERTLVEPIPELVSARALFETSKGLGALASQAEGRAAYLERAQASAAGESLDDLALLHPHGSGSGESLDDAALLPVRREEVGGAPAERQRSELAANVAKLKAVGNTKLDEDHPVALLGTLRPIRGDMRRLLDSPTAADAKERLAELTPKAAKDAIDSRSTYKDDPRTKTDDKCSVTSWSGAKPQNLRDFRGPEQDALASVFRGVADLASAKLEGAKIEGDVKLNRLDLFHGHMVRADDGDVLLVFHAHEYPKSELAPDPLRDKMRGVEKVDAFDTQNEAYGYRNFVCSLRDGRVWSVNLAQPEAAFGHLLAGDASDRAAVSSGGRVDREAAERAQQAGVAATLDQKKLGEEIGIVSYFPSEHVPPFLDYQADHA